MQQHLILITMHNEVNNITTLAFFANEVETFLQVVQNWNRVVYTHSDKSDFIAILDQNWFDDKKFCYIIVRCNNMAALFQVGRLFSIEHQESKLR